MLTREEDIDAHALRKRGWTISSIARHLGRDRKTIRAYLAGREPGVRDRSAPDPFEEFQVYAAQRLQDDPRLWAMTLFDELLQLGYDRSYPTLTRALRARGLRPACEACAPAKGRPVAVIEHPPGQETQWDWVELPDPPEHWGWGKTAHLLVGALSHSGQWRAVLCESEEQPHLIDGLDRVAQALGRPDHGLAFRPDVDRGVPVHRQGVRLVRIRGETLRNQEAGRLLPLGALGRSPPGGALLPADRHSRFPRPGNAGKDVVRTPARSST